MSYLSDFWKSYESIGEYEWWYANYMRIDEIIREHNSHPSQTYTLGHNQFSDVDEDEKN